MLDFLTEIRKKFEAKENGKDVRILTQKNISSVDILIDPNMENWINNRKSRTIIKLVYKRATNRYINKYSSATLYLHIYLDKNSDLKRVELAKSSEYYRTKFPQEDYEVTVDIYGDEDIITNYINVKVAHQEFEKGFINLCFLSVGHDNKIHFDLHQDTCITENKLEVLKDGSFFDKVRFYNTNYSNKQYRQAEKDIRRTVMMESIITVAVYSVVGVYKLIKFIGGKRNGRRKSK